jgi:hypothetical protein
MLNPPTGLENIEPHADVARGSGALGDVEVLEYLPHGHGVYVSRAVTVSALDRGQHQRVGNLYGGAHLGTSLVGGAERTI